MDDCREAFEKWYYRGVPLAPGYAITERASNQWEGWEAAWNAKPVSSEVPVAVPSVEELEAWLNENALAPEYFEQAAKDLHALLTARTDSRGTK